MEQSTSQALIESAFNQQDSEQHAGEPQSVTELEHSLLTLHANLSAATCRFLVLLRTFDERGGWHGWGVRSMAHWLGLRCGIALASAREHLRVAHALAVLPHVSAAFADGRISYSKARAITRVAPPLNEGCLLNIARSGTAAHLERVVAYARLRIAFENPDRLRALMNQARCDWH